MGYNILRMDPKQEWQPWNLGNPLYNALLAPIFEWGIAVYDLEFQDFAEGKNRKTDLRRDLKAMGRKIATQFAKDYVATPAVAALTGSVRAGAARHAHRQRDPQRLGPRGDLLRPLPRRGPTRSRRR